MKGSTRIRWGFLVAAMVVGMALPAPAQEPAPEPTPPPEALEPVPIPDVTAAADQVGRTLREIELSLAPSPAIENLEAGIPLLTGRIDVQERATTSLLEAFPTLEALGPVEGRWRGLNTALPAWSQQLTARAKDLEDKIVRLDRLRATWEATRKLARSEDAPPAIEERIGETLAAINKTRKAAHARRRRALTLQAQVAAQSARIETELNRLEDVREDLVSRIFEADSPPLWATDLRAQLAGNLRERLRASSVANYQDIRGFVTSHVTRIVWHFLLFGALVGLCYVARRRVRRRAEEERGLERVAEIFEFPLSMALLLAILVVPWLYPIRPQALNQAIGAVALVPTVTILRRLLAPPLLPILYGGMAFYLLDRVRGVMDGLPALSRFFFLAEIAAVIGLLAWMMRPARLAELPPEAARQRSFRFIGRAGRAALVLAIVAFVAQIAGFGRLGRLLGNGVLQTAYLAFLAYAAVRVLDSVATLLLRVLPVQNLGMIWRRRPELQRGVNRLLEIVAFGVWAFLTLEIFEIRGPVFRSVGGLLSAEFSIGSLTLSLGSIGAFVLTIWLAFVVSRCVRFVLDEDVYPRLRLPRGVPYATSSFIHYGVLLLGFFLAVVATGIDLNRFALVAGAFGVGIGFGLQNVVNNFVSGLILLSERPVQVGDTIQTGDVFGNVKRIGIRSSTIRTWLGAEVIVPNADLISEQVTNWTLSDRHKRIDIPVGVAYGTDPRAVVELLAQVGREHPDALEEPPPRALFRGFGDSALNFELRVWTGLFEEYVRVESELSMEINDVLKSAGITIPFPQRDLHLRSVSPAAGGALGTGPDAAADGRPGNDAPARSEKGID
jgi:small-conductance mechanosensitive channel